MKQILVPLTLVMATVLPSTAQNSVKDRAILSSCMDKARRDGTPREQCIGTIEGPCLKGEKGETTIGMKECTGREIQAWDELLNHTYRSLLAGELAKIQTERADASGKTRAVTGADILRSAQRAWISARDKKCDAAGLPMEGGTGAGLLIMGCRLRETAQQALWLEDLGAR